MFVHQELKYLIVAEDDDQMAAAMLGVLGEFLLAYRKGNVSDKVVAQIDPGMFAMEGTGC